MSETEILGEVAEVQGVYGPFTISELLFQKIWADGAYDHSSLFTTERVPVEIIDPGQWNKLAGPDFKHARLKLGDGQKVVGDVELHLRARDWDAHGHADDPAYADVKLHVVLFPTQDGRETLNGAGQKIPLLVLLPWLHHDLEEYAAEEAVERLANRSEARVLDLVGRLPKHELRDHLDRFALQRWQQKVHFAELRIDKVGWEEACHQTALEILGYRYNRVPMIRLASQYGLKHWTSEDAVEIDEMIAEEQQRWVHTGVRPANHPRIRLQQYSDWVQKCPDWPATLLDLAALLPRPDCDDPTSDVRRSEGLKALRGKLEVEVCGGVLGGTRLDTLICDGFLPLLASESGQDFSGLWYHWYLGDAPRAMVNALKESGRFDQGVSPACHGAVQSLLGWILAKES